MVAAYQSKIARHFNKKVTIRNFKEGDLVLRKVTQNTRKRSDGVLAPNWEGPYLIRVVVRNGAYKLEDMEGYPVDHTWNAYLLRKFYPWKSRRSPTSSDAITSMFAMYYFKKFNKDRFSFRANIQSSPY